MEKRSGCSRISTASRRCGVFELRVMLRLAKAIFILFFENRRWQSTSILSRETVLFAFLFINSVLVWREFWKTQHRAPAPSALNCGSSACPFGRPPARISFSSSPNVSQTLTRYRKNRVFSVGICVVCSLFLARMLHRKHSTVQPWTGCRPSERLCARGWRGVGTATVIIGVIVQSAISFLIVSILRLLSQRGAKTPMCAMTPIPVRRSNLIVWFYITTVFAVLNKTKAGTNRLARCWMSGYSNVCHFR